MSLTFLMACKCSLITLSDVTLRARHEIWTKYTNARKKTVNLLGSMIASWAMKRSLDSALTCIWISPHSRKQTEWDKKGTRLGSQSTTYHCKVVWDLNWPKENSDSGARLSDLTASSHHCGRLRTRSLSQGERNQPIAWSFIPVQRRKLHEIFTIQSGVGSGT